MFQDYNNDNAASDWKLHVWGVRSNAPASGENYKYYGGHTACVSVQIKNEMLIFDAGSGIAELGKNLAKAYEENPSDNSPYGHNGAIPGGTQGFDSLMPDMNEHDLASPFGDGSSAYSDDKYDELLRGLENEAAGSGFMSEIFSDMPQSENDDIPFPFDNASFGNDTPFPFNRGISAGMPAMFGMPEMSGTDDFENMLMLQEYEKDKKRASAPKTFHIFISSLSLDTVSALMSFLPLNDDKVTVNIYGSDMGGMNIAEALSTLFRPPFWRETLADVPAVIYFRKVIPGESFVIGSLGLLVSALNGRGGIMYRIEEAASDAASIKKCLVYGSACGPDAFTSNELKSFIEGAVLTVCDSAYSPEELFIKHADGHSSWKSWLPVIAAAGSQNALMLRYSDEYTDDILKVQAEDAAAEAGKSGTNCIFAREGMDIIL